MLFRNLMAMDVEESIRANPLDGVVLLCGCDKTTPAQLMGAASSDIPAIVVPGGPMLSGQWGERRLGAGSDGRKLFDLFRTGRLTEEQWCEIEGGMARSPGHCAVIHSDQTGIRERCHGGHGARRFHQCGRSPDCHCRTRRSESHLLRGNLAPDGAVLKQSAASPELLRHRGKAYVFENYQQMRVEIDHADLPVDKDTVLVMRNCGPKGAPGFPEWGHIEHVTQANLGCDFDFLRPAKRSGD